MRSHLHCLPCQRPTTRCGGLASSFPRVHSGPTMSPYLAKRCWSCRDPRSSVPAPVIPCEILVQPLHSALHREHEGPSPLIPRSLHLLSHLCRQDSTKNPPNAAVARRPPPHAASEAISLPQRHQHRRHETLQLRSVQRPLHPVSQLRRDDRSDHVPHPHPSHQWPAPLPVRLRPHFPWRCLPAASHPEESRTLLRPVTYMEDPSHSRLFHGRYSQLSLHFAVPSPPQIVPLRSHQPTESWQSLNLIQNDPRVTCP
mmetsp:Transcript_30002/g.73872  ORF Transcript_30002/g.73872 Transcript_30002/m.73872 type:complete len:256 (-) Transcript_30002:2396-3163(-)